MKKNPKTTRQAGFALIVTLSLMILLTVIAVGLLTLSSISLRSSGQSAAGSIARSNARLAMMLALGDLQVSMGVDKSVSAPASSVFATAQRPRLTGVWQSTAASDYWHWTPAPGGTPSFSNKRDRFSRWLVSTPAPSDAKVLGFADKPTPTASADAVALVGRMTASEKDSEGVSTRVVAEKVKVGGTTQSGKFGWAVFDESTKAAIDLGDPAVVQPAGLEVASRTVPSRFRADILDAKLSTLRTPRNLISLETAAVPSDGTDRSEFRKRFHDFTTGSIGLLTNTASGGLKTDLTSLFEPANLPSGSFVAPTAVTPYPSAFAIASGAPKWTYIRDHYRKYKTMTSASTGEVTYNLLAAGATDLRVNTAGVFPSPDTERLLPVIAKFQLVFSLVSHRHTYPGRAQYWDGKLGANQYAIPHLVYDPVITLYNPYDVTLSLAKTRIRVWDPPVGFRFTKIDKKTGVSSYFRDPNSKSVIPNTGGFTSLAQLQIAKQDDAAARKCFTLLLTDGTQEQSGTSLKLKPGEVKVFSPRVQQAWDWAWETNGGPWVFFDWNQGNEFGNQDHRTSTGVGQFGVEAVPNWSFRAGLQTDHLANGGTNNSQRYDASEYAFEKAENRNDGFVTMRVTDEVVLEIKPMVASASASKQFEVDILAGTTQGASTFDATNSGVKADTLRSYSFSFSGNDPLADMSEDPSKPIIKSINYTLQELLQENTDKTRGGKKPIAMLEMSARTTKEKLTDSKPWLYNNPVVEGADQNTAQVGLSHQSYDLRLFPLTSLDQFPGGIAVDPKTYRGYFGANGGLPEGSSFVPMLHVPVTATASLGDLIPTNMAGGSLLPRVVHPFGNSRAHPLIPSDKVSQTLGTVMMDHSFLLNDALWDSYYFSSLTAYDGGSSRVLPAAKTIKEVLTGVFNSTEPALNNRLIPVVNQSDTTKQVNEIAGLSDLERSRKLAKYVAIKGPFNLNSTSVDAWRAVLHSLRDRQVNGLDVKVTGVAPNSVTALSPIGYSNGSTTPFVRTGKPLAGAGGAPGMLWAGYKSLSDDEIKELAKQIVVEIKNRGVSDSAPPFSLAEFVNRRPGSSVQPTAGLLQTAIDNTKINSKSINADAIARDSKPVAAASIIGKRNAGVQTSSVMDGNSAEGAPSMLTQGDLMAALAPVATVRGDTFKIRSYGECTTPNGNTVLARAWCETIVQRVPDFVDSADLPETSQDSLTSLANRTFGRRFSVVSFRWLSEGEL